MIRYCTTKLLPHFLGHTLLDFGFARCHFFEENQMLPFVKCTNYLTKFQLMTNVGVTTNVMPNIIVELQKLKAKNENIKTTIGQIIQ